MFRADAKCRSYRPQRCSCQLYRGALRIAVGLRLAYSHRDTCWHDDEPRHGHNDNRRRGHSDTPANVPSRETDCVSCAR
jgi:hypothetical protein